MTYTEMLKQAAITLAPELLDLEIQRLSKSPWEKTNGVLNWSALMSSLKNKINNASAIDRATGSRGRGTITLLVSLWNNAKDKGVKQSLAKELLGIGKDIKDEALILQDFTQNRLLKALKARIPSYAAFGAGGAAAGVGVDSLFGGEHKLAGGGIGLIAGLVANYLRRKSYYGLNINW